MAYAVIYIWFIIILYVYIYIKIYIKPYGKTHKKQKNCTTWQKYQSKRNAICYLITTLFQMLSSSSAWFRKTTTVSIVAWRCCCKTHHRSKPRLRGGQLLCSMSIRSSHPGAWLISGAVLVSVVWEKGIHQYSQIIMQQVITCKIEQMLNISRWNQKKWNNGKPDKVFGSLNQTFWKWSRLGAEISR